MIYFLDADPKKAAQYLLPEHLVQSAEELSHLLCASTHFIIEDYRVHLMESRMRNPKGSYATDAHVHALERSIPVAQIKPTLVTNWLVATQDNWDWARAHLRALLTEMYGHLNPTSQFEEIRERVNWLSTCAIFPVLVGRVYSKQNTVLFPVCVPNLPGEYQVWRPHDPVSTYRLYYYTRHHARAKWLTARMPWWWRAWKNNSPPSLACPTERR